MWLVLINLTGLLGLGIVGHRNRRSARVLSPDVTTLLFCEVENNITTHLQHGNNYLVIAILLFRIRPFFSYTTCILTYKIKD